MVPGHTDSILTPDNTEHVSALKNGYPTWEKKTTEESKKTKYSIPLQV